MERRSFLRIAGGATTLLLAGCTGGDEDNDTVTGTSSEGWEWTPDVAIVEHELVVEGGDVTVEGVVENDSGERLTYAEVSVWLEDEDGDLLGGYDVYTSDLDDGGTWAFEVEVFEDPDDIDDYRIYRTYVSESDWEEDGVTIREHELIDNDSTEGSDSSSFPIVEGVAENVSGELLRGVEVFVLPYDEQGTPVGVYREGTEDLDDGETWEFEVEVLEDADDVEDYDIGTKTD